MKNSYLLTIFFALSFVAGMGTSYALPAHVSFEEYCMGATSDTVHSIDDFVCELDIFQMKEDVEHSKKFNFDHGERFSDTVTIHANSQYTHIAACSEGSIITNVGHTGTDVTSAATGFELNVHTSYQLKDNYWVLGFSNPSSEDIVILVKYMCLG